MPTFVALAPDATALFCTVITTFGLMLKMFFVAMKMGGARIQSGDRPPEDGPMFASEGKKRGLQYGFTVAPGAGGGPTATVSDNNKLVEAEQAAATVARYVRIMTNDLENIPMGLLLAWASVFTASESWAVTVHIVAVLTLFVSRVGHTVCYIYSLQPGRSIAWFLAFLAALVLGINATIASARLL